MPAGGNSRFRGYPARMSERQQLALLLQITSKEIVSSGESHLENSNQNSRSFNQHRGSKSRWSNKNDESPNQRKEESRGRSVVFNNQEQSLKKPSDERRENNPSEETRLTSDSPRSPLSETSGETRAPPVVQHQEQSNHSETFQHIESNIYSYRQQHQHTKTQLSQDQQQQHRPNENTSAGINRKIEESGALCEMRRTPPQNKVDRSGTGQTGSSPRVTLRLNQVRGARDDKKGTGASSRQSISSNTNQVQMDSTTKASVPPASTPSTPVTTTTAGASNATSLSTVPITGSTQPIENNDIYEFKSSKELTPSRGSSSSPNPEKDKENGSTNQNTTDTQQTPSIDSVTNTPVSGPTTAASNELSATVSSPSAKRPFEGGPDDEQDEEARKKKRKEMETNKDAKGVSSGRQNTGRATSTTNDKFEKMTSSVTPSSFVEQCTKSGKQGAVVSVGKPQQSSNASPATSDRKSPSALIANSPKPSANISAISNLITDAASTVAAGPTTAIPPHESDSEDDRPKSSDSNSAPKVPPLKIVIPQTSSSEQEQGARNGKSQSNRGHPLPYVVPSSNSNDSADKDPNQSASGTTSPTDVTSGGGGGGGGIGSGSGGSGSGSGNGNGSSGVGGGNGGGNGNVNGSSNGSGGKTVEEKKDFSGIVGHNEERSSTHHQRVLRSSHRSGNGTGNGNSTGNSKDSSSNQSNNGNCQNPSPTTTTCLADRSNNSSPQQRHNSPTPESTNSDAKGSIADPPITSNPSAAKTNSNTDKTEKGEENSGKNGKESSDCTENNSSTASTNTNTNVSAPAPVDCHPRKRKIRTNKEVQQAGSTAASTTTNECNDTANVGTEVHPHDQPITNCYQLFLNIRKQIERRRKSLFPVQPKPPQGFKDYLMNRCTYVLAGNANKEPNINPPVNLQGLMKDLYIEQEKERYRLKMQHVVEKEKLVLSVEQEILRVHGRAARALANQILPFSVCTILKDEEVYNVITPEQEEKDRNQRSRYNGRLFLSWLQDVDDKWEKIKEAMLLRHHNEAESLHAVQRMDWEWKLKEVGLCEFKATPQIDELSVPIVHVSDDFDLLPA